MQGKVESVQQDANSYILKIDEKEQFEVANNDLIIKRVEADYYLGWNFWFDAATKAPVHNLMQRRNKHWNPYGAQHYELERLDQHRVRVINAIDSLPEAGWHFIAKWRNRPNINRTAPAIHLQDAKRIQLSGINIYSAAGMGVIGEKSEAISLNRVNITTTPNSNRVVSTTADATHFVNCKGLIQLENCNFQSCLDDGLNIHGNYTTIHRTIDAYTLIGEVVHVQQEGFVFASAGDTLHHINPNTLLPESAPIVVDAYRIINDNYFELKSRQPLPKMTAGDGLDNITWSADLVIRDCRIERNWARGVLIKTSGKLLVENNYIASNMSGIRNWGEMNFFNESGRVTDVLIRSNIFDNVGRGGTGNPAIIIYPQIKDTSSIRQSGYYNKNIRITDNTFYAFDAGILFAQSIENLEFTNNKIFQTKAHRPLFPDRPGIEVRGCGTLNFSGNTYEGWEPAKMAIDQASIQNLLLKGNKGFLEK